MNCYTISERRGCAVLSVSRSVQRYVSRRDPCTVLRQRIKELAWTRIRYGYRRIHVLLRREGWQVNKKKVYRLYKEEGLVMRPKRPRRHVSAVRRVKPQRLTTGADDCWSMDFVSDQLTTSDRFRALTVIDIHTRECLAITVGKHLVGEEVVTTLNRIQRQRGAIPKHLACDNGSEFSGRMLDMWAYHHKVEIDFSRPGTPTDNAHIESFNSSFRDECLNTHWFLSMTDARVKIDAWRTDYNASRPHRALNDLSPLEYRAKKGFFIPKLAT